MWMKVEVLILWVTIEKAELVRKDLCHKSIVFQNRISHKEFKKIIILVELKDILG